MKIDLKRIAIRDIAEGYEDNGELGGVVGYGGNLDIRPKYQREFIYKDNQRDAVIRTVMSGFPLNVLYWAVNDDGKYEMLDGQQRTISVCQFVQGDFSFDHGGSPHFFHNLPAEVQKKFYDYKLHIYFCEGSDGEKLDWFRTINVAGERLTDQELRNAVYCGSWVSAAKVWFSRTGGAAYSIAKYYISGTQPTGIFENCYQVALWQQQRRQHQGIYELAPQRCRCRRIVGVFSIGSELD